MDLQTLSDTPPWDWPTDAAETILGALRDNVMDDSERRLAAELAGNHVVISDDMAEALLAVVSSPEEGQELRGTAAIALGPILEHSDVHGFDDPRNVLVSERVEGAIRDSLREVYLDAEVPKEVRRRALEASVRRQEDWHPEAVRAAFHSGDDAWKLTAVFCMTHVGGFDDEIVQALESGDPALCHEAVEAAGNWAVDAAWAYIRSLVGAEDINRELLLTVIAAVGSIRPAEAADALAGLAESEDDEIADAVFEALSMAEGLSDAEEDPDFDELDGNDPPLGPSRNGDGSLPPF